MEIHEISSTIFNRIQDLEDPDSDTSEELSNIFKVKNQVQSPNFINNKMSDGYADKWLHTMSSYREIFDKILNKYNRLVDQSDILIIEKIKEINKIISDIEFITTKLKEKI